MFLIVFGCSTLLNTDIEYKSYKINVGIKFDTRRNTSYTHKITNTASSHICGINFQNISTQLRFFNLSKTKIRLYVFVSLLATLLFISYAYYFLD